MIPSETYNQQQVLAAFGRQSPVFDEIDRSNALIGWVRDQVREAIQPYLQPGSRILELNCGTGIDALYFVSQGHAVLATDQSADMLEQLHKKWSQSKPQGNGSLQTRRLSFTDLDQLSARSFSFVFSNFGGLNCTLHLDQVLQGVDRVLEPGGVAALVIMPPICPWEWAQVFRGYFRTAFRRFRKGGAPARVEGVPFRCSYYSVPYIRRNCGPRLKIIQTMSLCLTVPPPFVEGFIQKHPRWFQRLAHWENKLRHRRPFRNWGDHILVVLRKEPLP